MAIMRWRPWAMLLDDDFAPAAAREGECRLCPAVDVSEDKDNIYVDMEIPGMSKEDIKVSLEHNVLSLKGEKKQEKEIKEENYHRWERDYGLFSRAFELPFPVQADKIKASYKNGILHVELPKAEEVKPKEISVEVN